MDKHEEGEYRKLKKFHENVKWHDPEILQAFDFAKWKEERPRYWQLYWKKHFERWFGRE